MLSVNHWGLVNLVGDDNLKGSGGFPKQWENQFNDILGTRDRSHMR